MKVVKWGRYDYDAPEDSNTQKEYKEANDPNPQETYKNLCDEIRKHRYMFDGEYHQKGLMGCPILEDGSYMLYSWRSWGGVMADAWGPLDGKSYNYMDFYMLDRYDDNYKTPEYELEGFVRPERPIQTKPELEHIDKFQITASLIRVRQRAVDLIDTIDMKIVNTPIMASIKNLIEDIEKNVGHANEGLDKYRKNAKAFYKEHPEFDPKEIKTLCSKDGLQSVRVYAPYANMTFEEVHEKYNQKNCSDNQMEAVFPDWNRFEKDFSDFERNTEWTIR